MSEPIQWTNERRKLSQLIPWPRNPRLIYEEKGKRLVKSYKRFAQTELILIEPDNGLLNGHQRLKVWGTEFGPDLEVEVRVASRKLTEKEKEELTVYLHKGATGDFDMDLLSEWDVPDLLEWGFEKSEIGFDMTSEEPEKTEPETIPEQYMILVECEDEQTQAELLDRFNVEGLKCRALIS